MHQGMNPEVLPDEQSGFWTQQYGPHVTPQQLVFDVMGGVILPLVCLWFDPFVFQSSRSLGEPLFAKSKVAAYCFVAVEILTLLYWLSMRRYVGRFAGLTAGVLCAGAVGSTLLGVLLFPFSVVGLLAIVGVLGFSPFLVGWIFLRNGLRALRATSRSTAAGVRYSAWIGGLLVAIAPFLAQSVVLRQISQYLHVAIDGEEVASRQALERLMQWRWVVRPLADLDRLVTEFDSATDPSRRDRIAAAYETIANERIEDRIAAMND